jgi:sterol O-acyltransferase
MAGLAANGDADQHQHILRPRPRKALPEALRTSSNSLGVNAYADVPSGVSRYVDSGACCRCIHIRSGRSTPVPQDAPPSVQSLSTARKAARAQAKHRLFHTINYVPRVSHFDPQSEYRDFRGFFVLFWISLSIMVITTGLRNVKETGHPLRVEVYELLSRNVISLALSDAAMVGSTALSLPLQRLARTNGFLRWRRVGIWLQSLYQTGWLLLWVSWPFLLDWTWTAQVFFALHTLTFLMKTHSYAFYNGHLSETERRLHDLDAPTTADRSRAIKYPSSPSRLQALDPDSSPDEKEEQEELEQLRQDLAKELTSPLGQVTYPQNLTLYNYADYVLCPTLCYELEYPRTPKIRWDELFYKTLAVFGCIFLMITISEEFITPVLAESAARLRVTKFLSDKALILAETTSLMLFPFMITFLLVFLVIWEYILGAFAEITCFADRHFYSDWWNSSDWLEFSREWNIPVYHFLRRHVFFSSKTYFSTPVAMVITFLISSLGHELIMGCITKKLRGYGFFAMMLQLPIVALQRSKLFKGRWVLNNAAFWSSMVLGLSMMCSLYVLV